MTPGLLRCPVGPGERAVLQGQEEPAAPGIDEGNLQAAPSEEGDALHDSSRVREGEGPAGGDDRARGLMPSRVLFSLER